MRDHQDSVEVDGHRPVGIGRVTFGTAIGRSTGYALAKQGECSGAVFKLGNAYAWSQWTSSACWVSYPMTDAGLELAACPIGQTAWRSPVRASEGV